MRALDEPDRRILGQDLMRLQFRWPAAGFSTLDGFLTEEETLEEFQAIAIKEVLAWQLEAAMKEQKLSRKHLAERMATSRSQVSRLLDPTDGNVTPLTLQRAAAIVGRKVRLEFV
jgi:predicted XRE-type DNA-binding protein